MRNLNESSQSYLINQYFIHAKLEQEMMHTTKHRFFLSGLPKLLLSSWHQSLYEPLESHKFDPMRKAYELNKLKLTVYVLMFVMFHDDGKIDHKEMKLLKRYVQYVKQYDTQKNAEALIQFLKSEVSIQSFQSIYIKNGYSFSMFQEVMDIIKKRMHHSQYLNAWTKLESTVKSL